MRGSGGGGGGGGGGRGGGFKGLIVACKLKMVM